MLIYRCVSAVIVLRSYRRKSWIHCVRCTAFFVSRTVGLEDWIVTRPERICGVWRHLCVDPCEASRRFSKKAEAVQWLAEEGNADDLLSDSSGCTRAVYSLPGGVSIFEAVEHDFPMGQLPAETVYDHAEQASNRGAEKLHWICRFPWAMKTRVE